MSARLAGSALQYYGIMTVARASDSAPIERCWLEGPVVVDLLVKARPRMIEVAVKAALSSENLIEPRVIESLRASRGLVQVACPTVGCR